MDDPEHKYPIDGELDLHQFSPKETRELLAEYIRECLSQGIHQLRVVHGKGIGVQREIVRSFLASHADVKAFRHESGAGGWGATVVDLRHPDDVPK